MNPDVETIARGVALGILYFLIVMVFVSILWSTMSAVAKRLVYWPAKWYQNYTQNRRERYWANREDQ